MSNPKRIHIQGTGSIIEVERGRKYRIRWRLPPEEPGGKRRWSAMRTVYGNKSDARRELEAYRNELEDQLNGKGPSDMTVGDFATTWHHRRAESGLLSPLTIDRERIEIEKIVNLYGQAPLDRLSTEEIEKGYDALRESGSSPHSVHMVQATLSQILKQAVDDDLIDKNPAATIRDASRPKPKERRSLSLDQAVKLASDLRDSDRDGRIVAVWLALATGMRRGEVLGLQWRDVDLESSRITVRHQLDSRCRLRDPKSSSSIRNLAIDEGTVRFLSEWRDQQSTLYFGGGDVADEVPVCSNLSGGWLDPNVFSRWRRAWFADHGLGHFSTEEEYVDRNGVKRIRRSGYEGFNLHELRHTQATLLIGTGEDIKTVQHRLGHSSASLTMNIYAHAIAQNDRDAATSIGRIINESD
ncbi:MAG: site-specific integrase [Atopobiaceae bacterium]|nr:site-specific integrase [Atopobiaceae bacterium]